MWNCPVCGKENPTMVCVACQFDGSCDYERYPTLTSIFVGESAVSQIQEENTSIFYCPDCGSETFTLTNTGKRLKCLQCNTLFELDATDSIIPFEDTKQKRNIDQIDTEENRFARNESQFIMDGSSKDSTVNRWKRLIAATMVLTIILSKPSCWIATNSYQRNDTVLFDNGDVTKIGWQTIAGKTYYFDNNGVPKTGFQTIDGEKYYFNSDGAMQYGFQNIDGKTYCFNSDGIMQTGWKTIDGERLYFDDNGALQNGWVKDTIYYQNGYEVTGTQTINGEIYHFDEHGILIE